MEESQPVDTGWRIKVQDHAHYFSETTVFRKQQTKTATLIVVSGKQFSRTFDAKMVSEFAHLSSGKAKIHSLDRITSDENFRNKHSRDKSKSTSTTVS